MKGQDAELVKSVHGLHAGPVVLRYGETVVPVGHPELTSYFHFKILTRKGEEAGHINFRIGDSRHVMLVAGHIGYAVAEEFQGRYFSYFACQALLPLISKKYKSVIITTNPDNIASIRIIEKIGARFLGEINVPEDDPAYAGGARRKLRYEWVLPVNAGLDD